MPNTHSHRNIPIRILCYHGKIIHLGFLLLAVVVLLLLDLSPHHHSPATMFVAAAADAPDDQSPQNCGSWLGPSLLKNSAEHGYGLGIFTGVPIAKGTLLGAEPLIPVYDFRIVSVATAEEKEEEDEEEEEEDDKYHPPLREFLWSGNDWHRLVLESFRGLLIFAPGLASIAPCTSTNFHLEQVVGDYYDGSDGDSAMKFDNAHVQRATDPTAGSFTYYQTRMFRAVRDISVGEELTVECSDDDFDAAALWSGDAASYNPTIHTCLDDKVETKRSTLPTVGHGVFAKKQLPVNSVVLTSPAVPVHRNLVMGLDSGATQQHPHRLPHLLLNYCIGHPDSDLLWLPYGPWINSINHFPSETTKPNVKLVWHQPPADPAVDNRRLPRRQQYHHPELLEFPPERVAQIHGKGLAVDIVALRNILPGEELFLDYGSAWTEAWKKHSSKWSTMGPKLVGNRTTIPYKSAWEFNEDHTGPIRTITEQHTDPYPPNIITACRFEKDWIDDEYAEDYDMIQYQSWDTQENHFQCLLPCLILERLPGKDDGSTETTYTAKLVDHHHENENIEYNCHIFRRFEYIYTDIPRRGIEFIESTYSSDIFLGQSFRHAIGPSEGMWPDHWMRKRVRLRRQAPTPSTDGPKDDEDHSIFKRKNLEPNFDMEDLQWKRDASPRVDL